MGTAGDSGVSLRRLRLLAGMSLRELAERAGVTHSLIARAEQGHTVSKATCDALAAVLGPKVYEAVATQTRPRLTSAGLNPVVAARHRMGLPRKYAAKRIGVSDKTLARVEAGQRVRPINAKRIAFALGLDVGTVLDLVNEDDANGEAA